MHFFIVKSCHWEFKKLRMNDLKISVITVVLNSQKTIETTINSVLEQNYPNLEYIIIDGGSTDGTKEIIEKYGERISRFVSEIDKGIYDALNKGIKMATGDIVGVLNSDDFYANNNVLKTIANEFRTYNVDSFFADVRFVSDLNLTKTIRYISGKSFKLFKLRFGFMPPHPTLYIKRKYFEEYGYYKTDYKIASDFELIIRFFFINKISYRYIPKELVKMRYGGKSTKSISSNYIINREIVKGCRENGIYTNMFLLLFKYFFKSFEFLK